LRAHLPVIAHVQLADAPGRGEPGTGEIRFAYVLKELEALGYSGYVGLEYRPSAGHTEASLAWLPAIARAGDFPASSLVL
jgi:hydroxypyruvate isomerase